MESLARMARGGHAIGLVMGLIVGVIAIVYGVVRTVLDLIDA